MNDVLLHSLFGSEQPDAKTLMNQLCIHTRTTDLGSRLVRKVEPKRRERRIVPSLKQCGPLRLPLPGGDDAVR
jgi:hypothetical protein